MKMLAVSCKDFTFDSVLAVPVESAHELLGVLERLLHKEESDQPGVFLPSFNSYNYFPPFRVIEVPADRVYERLGQLNKDVQDLTEERDKLHKLLQDNGIPIPF